jgi:hypothetical protein
MMNRFVYLSALIVVSVMIILAVQAPSARAEAEVALTEKVLARVIPLPKEAHIARAHTATLSEAGIAVPTGASPLLGTIREVMAPIGEGTARRFTIRFALCENGDGIASKKLLDRLETLPNADQAYAIVPTYDDKKSFTGLGVVARTELGLLYGARTLRQMMNLRAAKGADAAIAIPELTLVDWPDMPERGMWGSIGKDDLAWLAERKLNIVDHTAQVSYDAEKGRGAATVDPEMLAEAARVGITIVPIIYHLELIYERSGVADKRPDLTATEGRPTTPSPRAGRRIFCFSKPGTVQILGDWFEDLVQISGVTDIIVWLSEDEWRCSCDECRDKEPYLLEVAALVKAFERAKAVNPESSLRILLTQGSYHVNDKIVAAVPEDVKLVYYDGGRTYDSSHKPMIYPLLESYARSGRWLGVYPQVTNAWRTITPWTAPQFIRYRMNEFVTKGLHNVIMYAVPKPQWHQYNITAGAEWMWNSRGRDETHFSHAWATSRGVADPDLFAKWATLVGPIGWDLAGSRLAMRLIYYFDVGAPREGFQPVRYGEMFLEEIYSEEHLNALIRQADDALALALELEDELAVSETRIHRAFLILGRALQVLSEAPESPEGLSSGQLERYRVAFDDIDAAARTLEVEHFRWAELVEPGERPSRLMDTVAVGYRSAARAAEVMDQLGIRDPMPAYHPREIGSWSPDDFADGPDCVLSLDMHEAWAGAGPYVLYFMYDHRGGTYGVRIRDIVLAGVQPDGTETELKKVSFNRDVHLWHQWEEVRFDFPQIAPHSTPRFRVILQIQRDASEAARKSYGTVRLRKGLVGTP